MQRLNRLLATATAAVALTTTGAAVAAAPSAHAATSPPTIRNGAWAGYITKAPKGHQIEWVMAQFKVPKAKPARSVGPPPYMAAMWVGIDGFVFNNEAINGPWQVGVREISWDKKNVHYDIFWEMYPGKWHFFKDKKGGNAQVHPGDTVTMIVEAPDWMTDHKYHFEIWDLLADNSNNIIYQASGYMPPGWHAPRSEAEVITENPTDAVVQGSGLLDMGAIHYTSADYGYDVNDENLRRSVAQIRLIPYHNNNPIIGVSDPSSAPGLVGGGGPYVPANDEFTTTFTGWW
jgi:hypothetical protein